MAAAGKSRFSVTCALLRRYMREHQGQMGDLAGLFQAPAPPVAPEENDDDRIMQLFPMRAVAMPAQAGDEEGGAHGHPLRGSSSTRRSTDEGGVAAQVPREEEGQDQRQLP
ncbi:protein TIFY 11d-like [Panicum virgatum]|uniref:protein TIFY 11d-like n=1 Tax=Panicum virgatum TaxID=38727 RepID=UPI0019D60E52|nr:protein TIFY 11d-like [Panicum virgatum]